jgi:hypothetical protein
VSGGTCQLILRLSCLSFQTRGCACTSRRPSSWPLCSLRWRCTGVGDAAECEDYLRVNMRITCRREALERVSDIERRRRRPGLRLLCVSGPGQIEPGRVAIIRPCAPHYPRRRTRSFPVGRSPSKVVGDHASSSELSLITLDRTHRMEMISTLTKYDQALREVSHGRTTEDVAEPIHLISIAAN